MRRAVAAVAAATALLVASCTDEGTTGPATRDSTATSPADTSTPGTGDPDVPGTLVEVEELDADVPGRVHRVEYRSRGLTGEPTVVSGILALPRGEPPDGGWPVLSWAHGTAGVADECAPSHAGAEAVPLLADHLAAGYAVAATDYEGLGTEGVHPYLVLESEGRSVLDAVRATQELDPRVGDRVALVGHSQGGHAALAAAEIASAWAPELDVVGTVAIAPAADIEVIAPALFSSAIGFTLGAYIAAGWPAAHPELDAADLLTPQGLELVEAAVDGACSFALGALIGDRSIDELRTATPDALDDWSARIADNTIHPDRVDVPALIVQGHADRVVPAPLADQLVRDLCAADAAVGYLEDPDADHVSIVERAMPDIHRWLSARADGVPLDAAACATG